jgi:BirA family biotin operon repressor/biotin-[acetyl-CoA-carboxylase] ligase
MKESLSAAAISTGLESTLVGQRVLYYPLTTTTMEIARQEARRKTPEGTVIVAGEQTAGRGRLGRSWISPGGNVALSIILYPRRGHLSSLIMLASLAVVRCIKAVTGLKADIKWPNDILINGRKVCGILIENDVQKDTVNYSILGIGVNVNLEFTDFPEIQSIATSLSQELGKEVSRLSVVRRLLLEIEKLYLALKAGESIYEEWRDSLVTLGKRVRVTAGETVSEGIAESVDRDGSLLLRHSDGGLTRIIAGEVTLRE